jgi:hypothetical protein
MLLYLALDLLSGQLQTQQHLQQLDVHLRQRDQQI